MKPMRIIHAHLDSVRRLCLLGLTTTLLGLTFGCANLRSGGAPPPSYDIDADLKQLESHFGTATAVENYYAKPQPTLDDRNRVISARLVMINLQYLKWLRSVTADKQLLDTAADILVLSLNLAGTATPGVAAKTALAAVSAGIAGSKTTIDKNFYYERTIPALVAAMNAQRKTVLTSILSGMSATLKAYSFEQALTDIYEYYQAGTLVGAVDAIQADSGAKEKTADLGVAKARLKLLDLATPDQLKDEAMIQKVWNELFNQINTGAKIADPAQKTKLHQALSVVLGSDSKLPEEDAELVKELHRFMQIQPERSGELVKALNDAQYRLPQ